MCKDVVKFVMFYFFSSLNVSVSFREHEDNAKEKIIFLDRKSTRLNSSHMSESRMPSSA